MCALGESSLPTELLIKIFEHVPFRDMASVRLACKRWNHIADQVKFNGSYVTKITPRNAVEILHGLQTKPNAWTQRMENLRICQIKCTPELIAILDLARSFVRTLELKDSTLNHNQMLPNVKELRLSSSEPRKLSQSSAPQFVFKSYDSRNYNEGKIDLQNFPKLNSLVLETTVEQKLRLQMLNQLNSLDTRVLQLQFLRFELTNEEEELAVNVLRKHAPTLKFLELFYFSSHNMKLENWLQLFKLFSKLESLLLTGGFSRDWLKTLFTSLNAELKIRHLDLSGCYELDDETLKLILQRWPNNLQNMSLMFCSKITDSSLQYLQHQRNLQVLCLIHCVGLKIGSGLVEGISSYSNLQLRRLYLNDHHLNENTFCRIITQLPNLEHLSLMGCTNAITDHTMSYIFQKLQQLRVLDLSNCYKLSDDGLLGSNNHSIQHLRQLHTLSLCGYRNLTDSTFQKALKLDNLRSLALGYSQKITAIGIASLVKNCPLLESLTISSCLMIDDKAIWHIATGLKKLRTLNLSNCVNLTERAIDFIEEHCDHLVNLILLGIEAIDVEDVQQRLWKIQPQVKVADVKDMDSFCDFLKLN